MASTPLLPIPVRLRGEVFLSELLALLMYCRL